MYGMNLFSLLFLLSARLFLAEAEDCEYYDGNGICKLDN